MAFRPTDARLTTSTEPHGSRHGFCGRNAWAPGAEATRGPQGPDLCISQRLRQLRLRLTNCGSCSSGLTSQADSDLSVRTRPIMVASSRMEHQSSNGRNNVAEPHATGESVRELTKLRAQCVVAQSRSTQLGFGSFLSTSDLIVQISNSSLGRHGWRRIRLKVPGRNPIG